MKSENARFEGFTFEVDGLPAIAIINSDLKNNEQRFEYKYSVFIEIIPEAYNKNGHPEEKEQDFLVQIENEIITFLEIKTETVYIGNTILPRKKEIIFYTKMPEAVELFLKSYLPFIQRKYDFEISLDQEWESVSGFYNQL
jgi:hypothetical protein